MQGYVANTHRDWFDFLAGRQTCWDEVNFWTPSAHYAFRGPPESPFLFRLQSPRNAIGGFGLVARFEKLPEWLAWECFGEGNGAATLADFQARLRDLRKTNRIEPSEGPSRIGCIILSPAYFFRPDAWIEQPSDWGRQNLRYKQYDLARGEGLRIWRECLDRVRAGHPEEPGAAAVRDASGRLGEPRLVRPRLGQGVFRLSVTHAYDDACAMTGEHSLPALEAAHIRPFGQGGEHRVDNGLLLRSDLHRLFDRGYITVTRQLRVEVSARLRADFENGRTYYPLHGQRLRAPKDPADAPDPECLAWHNENVYLSAG
ncbi:MAG: hypothetical protein Fur0037_26400 [Planctomycetota bacterium]